MAMNVVLCLSINGQYQPALSIPVGTFQIFSTNPLAWLHYLGFTIYGCEGHISNAPGGQPVNYGEATIQNDMYYYVADDMFLLDPDLMDDRTPDGSAVSVGQENFRENVIHCDGVCVMTGAVSNYEACHIIPHAKGHENKYVINLVNHRHGAPDPPLESINDICNGILLYSGFPKPFGASVIAFLQTPNFAMNVDNVDCAEQLTFDDVGFDAHPSEEEKCLTFQHFGNLDNVTALIAPHNSDARMSHDNDWPPPLFFDVAYGCAALNTWGVHAFIATVQQHTWPIYYGKRGGLKKSNLADVVVGLWMANAQKGQHQACKLKYDRTWDKSKPGLVLHNALY